MKTHQRSFRPVLVCLAASVIGVVAAAPALALNLETVPVGNAGNSPDYRYSVTGLGAVATAYSIGKYEVTAGQYTEFLNAVADADPNSLYSTQMANLAASAQGCNIVRTGVSGAYVYSVAADWADRPVNWISFWDAARFANWLHNGQPNGPQGPTTTEAGAYANVGNQATFARQPNAKFFIPTEDEWYKAAFHNQAAGTAGDYFDYAQSSNSVPGADITESTNPAHNANYLKDGNNTIGAPYYRTVVGEFELSKSPYGTFDQNGNVYEWVETVFDAGASRGLRGGGFTESFLLALRAGDQEARNSPTQASGVIGFRVAAVLVPEPGSLVMVVGAALLLLIGRQRQSR